MEFKERIFQARKAKGLSQEELAEMIGVSRQAVSKWETGEAMPDMEKMLALCNALELNMEYLALGKEPIGPVQQTTKRSKWVAVLLAAALFVSGLIIGIFLPQDLFSEPGPLETIQISDIKVTPFEVVSPGRTDYEIDFHLSEMPEGLAVAVMYGDLNGEPGAKLCTQEGDRYRVTLCGHFNFHQRISVLLTLDGEEREIRILDIRGNENGIQYDHIT